MWLSPEGGRPLYRTPPPRPSLLLAAAPSRPPAYSPSVATTRTAATSPTTQARCTSVEQGRPSLARLPAPRTTSLPLSSSVLAPRRSPTTLQPRHSPLVLM